MARRVAKAVWPRGSSVRSYSGWFGVHPAPSKTIGGGQL